MCDEKVPRIATLEMAMAEYYETGEVQTTRCERCGSLIEIKHKGESVLLVRCDCGAYNDTIRGL